MALTNWNDILNKPAALEQVDEIALEVSQLSSSVLTIAGDVQELELSVADLSASVLTIGGKVQELSEEYLFYETETYTATIAANTEELVQITDTLPSSSEYDLVSATINIISQSQSWHVFGFYNVGIKYALIQNYGAQENVIEFTVKYLFKKKSLTNTRQAKKTTKKK